jgi:predicted dehydrogenase/threonine dehydrogenase-like Zn-dependent dehydrogenase
MALVRTSASLVSAGTERMLVDFAEKNLLEKAQSRPDLVQQVLDKAKREGLLQTVEAAFNRLDQPQVLGYSSAGTIVEAGPGLTGFKVGDRVACGGGGHAVHAEYGVVPQNLMAHIPDNVDFDSAAFTTLGAIAMHGFRMGQPQVGENVGIVGLGLLGLLAVGIAHAAGCHVFGVDLDPRRVDLAKKMGAQAVVRDGAEQAVFQVTHGMGCDLVLICADTKSDDPINLAGAIARDRARVVAVGAVGLDIPRKTYYEKELSVVVSRSYGPGRYDLGYEEEGRDYPAGFVRWTEGRNFQSFLDLLGEGRLDLSPIITHRFPIDEAPAAYELITGKTGESFLGVLLTYPNAELSQQRRVTLKNLPIQPAAGELRLGVLGAGNYAQATFLPVVKNEGGITPALIVSAAGLTARYAADKFGFTAASTREEDVFEDATIQLTAILTRHNEHARQVCMGLKAHQAVYCEKPLALNREELNEIQKTVEANPESLLTVGFNRRFAPLAIRMKEELLPGGEPLAMDYTVNAGYLPLNHWTHDPQVGGGRLIGEGCHFIDLMTWMADSLPVEVTARALPDGGKYRQDNAVILITFANGSVGTLHYLANGDKSYPKERLEVFSGGRVAVLNDFRSLQWVNKGNSQTMRASRQDKGHAGAWRAFLKAVRSGGQPPIPYSDLWTVTQATFAAVESLRTGAPVKVE